MGEKTTIGWCHHTFNPWWGCWKISPGCDLCYAEADAKRYGHDVWGKDAPRRFFSDKHWNDPLRWERAALEAGERRRVFCASMADIAEANPLLRDEKARLWSLVRRVRGLDWLLLTKRPGQLAADLKELVPDWGEGWAHAWLGTTVENNEFRKRIPVLLRIPAEVHFLSIEPQIGPVDLKNHLGGEPRHRVDWVIIGGESGGANIVRPFEESWAEDIIGVCTEAGVPVYNKQLGTKLARALGLADRKGADPAEWKEHLRVRDFPVTSLTAGGGAPAASLFG